MALAIGARLSHYRITASLGAGGMGEVYAVEDLNLGRQLALKLLPVEYTRETDRVRRFNQEARDAAVVPNAWLEPKHICHGSKRWTHCSTIIVRVS